MGSSLSDDAGEEMVPSRRDERFFWPGSAIFVAGIGDPGYTD
jgi:hypothetical protein